MQNAKLNNKFHFIPDIAIADIAFEAYGANYSELFENAGLAVEEAMVVTKTVSLKKGKEIQLEAGTVDSLLFLFLEELVFLKDAEGMVFSKVKCKVSELDVGSWRLEGEMVGEEINPNKHKLRDDVKAITKHMFELKQLPDKTFRCQVILDV